LTEGSTSIYPIAISIFDLEILAFYLKDPFEFLYYVRQRVALYKYYRASSEVVLLGAHLRHKLSRRPDVDGEALDGSFAQLIDANFPAMKGHVPMTKAVERLHHKWKNADFNKLVARVKESAEPNFTDAIFFLYDLSSDSADNLITNIKKAKEKCRRDGQQHDFSLLLADGKGVQALCVFPIIQTKLNPG
jgi:hypothetical protein